MKILALVLLVSVMLDIIGPIITLYKGFCDYCKKNDKEVSFKEFKVLINDDKVKDSFKKTIISIMLNGLAFVFFINFIINY